MRTTIRLTVVPSLSASSVSVAVPTNPIPEPESKIAVSAGAEIVTTYKNIAIDIVKDSVKIGGLVGDAIEVAQTAEEIEKLIEFAEKLRVWLSDYAKALDEIENFVNGNNCQTFTRLSKVANQLL